MLSGILPGGRFERVLLASALICGVFLRFWNLGGESFWLDEVFSARIVDGPVWEIVDRIPPDKPPLDYFLQALASPLGEPEFSHRLPAAVAGVLAMMGLTILGGLLGGERLALVTGMVAALNPYLVYYSQEARPYSVFLALTVVQMTCLVLWLRGGARRRWLLPALILAISAALVYTLYAGLVVLGAEWVYLLGWAVVARGEDRGRALRRAVEFAGIGGIVLLCLWPMRSRSALHPPEDYFWRFDGSVTRHWAELASQSLWGSSFPVAWWSAIAAFVVIGLGVVELARTHPRGHWLLVTVSLVPAFLLVYLYVYIDRSYIPRYSMFGEAGLMIVFAAALMGLGRMASRVLPASAGAIVYTLIVAHGVVTWTVDVSNRPHKTGWKAACGEIAREAMPGDIVVVADVTELWPTEYYLGRFGRGDIPIILQKENPAPPAGGTVWSLMRELDEDRSNNRFRRLSLEAFHAAPPSGPIVTVLAGEEATFELESVRDELLGPGWGAPEKWSEDLGVRWAVQKNATFFLPLRRAGGGTLTVRLMRYVSVEVPAQRVRVIVNEHAGEELELAGDGFEELRWQVPAESLVSGYNRVVLEFAVLRSPSEDRVNYGDFRSLAGAVDFIRWEEGAAGDH